MGHPPRHVNFSERLYEKKLDSFAQARSWHRRLRTLWLSRQLTRLGEPKGQLFKRSLARV